MANSRVTEDYSVQHLDFMEPPLPASGGRLTTAAGEMAQIISNEAVRHIVYIEFKADGKPRGNHYHVNMQMHGIYVIKGKLEVTLVDLGDQSRTVIALKSGDVIRIKPNCAHVFVAQEYTQALEFNDTPYDPADTIPYKVKD